MAFRHVVMFKFEPGVSDEAKQALHDGLSTLPGQIPEIVSYYHGPDAGLSPGAFDYAVVAEFKSAEDWVTYRDHPVHQKLIAELVVGIVAERKAVQFESPAG